MKRIVRFGSLGSKLRTIRSYNRVPNLQDLRSPQDFIQEVLVRSQSLSDHEKPIAREARSVGNGSFLLKEPRLERLRTILHVGWGMDVVAETGFDFPRLSKVIASAADPKFRHMVFEAAGLICVAATQPLRSSLIGLPVPRTFDRNLLNRFIHSMDRESLDMMSHGFGRGLYFKTFTLGSSLKRALSCPSSFHPGSVVKGVGFAFAMVNCRSLPDVFDTAVRLKERKRSGEEMEFPRTDRYARPQRFHTNRRG